MTIRHALSLLEAEGLIRFEHGVGTFVTDSGLDPDALQLVSFGETTASTSLQTVLRRVDPNANAPEAARLLGLPPETLLVMLERLRLLGGVGVRRAGVDLELLQHLPTERALRQHALHRQP